MESISKVYQTTWKVYQKYIRLLGKYIIKN
nr:MAG TPA: hypothetical protein [Caudoviricetes sp.]